MNELREKLDEANVEIKILKAEYEIKEELFTSLKKAYNDQLLRFQESKQMIAEQARELNCLSEELSEAGHVIVGLKSSLHEKELFLRQLGSAKEKVSADCREKLLELEGEKRKLVSALDDALSENKELQQKLSASSVHCEGLKELLLVSEKKCVGEEQKAQVLKELKIRDDVMLKLEEDNRIIRDQLKSMTEQFKHLEEAHKQIQDQFKLSEMAWGRDTSAMHEEIFLLQTRLDSETRISRNLRNQLEMCNQALAHQESMRKLLEGQLSEFKLHCKNEFQEDEMMTESLTAHGDEEIARLRNSLGNKDTLLEELKLKVAHLEQENEELVKSLKEVGESQRNTGTASLVTELSNKLKCLEQVHCNCPRILKARESEWRSQMEEIKDNITSYKSELESKEKEQQECHTDLENFRSTIDVLNEEISILLMVLKLEVSEAYCEVLNKLRQCSKQKDDKITILAEQLEMKNDALKNAQLHIEQEHEKVATLLKRVEALDFMDQRLILLLEELERHKKMLHESSECQLQLKQQVLLMENALHYDRREIFDVLEKAEFLLAEKIRDGNRLEVELQNLKFTAKSFEDCLGANEYTCRQMETSLLGQAESEENLEQEKECVLGVVKELSIFTQQTTTSEREALEALIEERDNILQISEEKDIYIETLHNDISWLMEDSIRRELEVEVCSQLDAEKAYKEEERLLKVLSEKEQKFRDLQMLVMSMEEDLISTVTSCFSEITQIQIEISAVSETLNKQRKLEIEEKNNIIAELEKELKSQKAETEKLMNQFGNEKSSMTVLIKELEMENGVLLQDIKKLSAEKENILVHIEELYDQLSEISCADAELMITLEKLQSCEQETEPVVEATELVAGVKASEELLASAKQNANNSCSPTMTKIESYAEGRSPLKELNN